MAPLSNIMSRIPKGARVLRNGDVIIPKKGSIPPHPIQGFMQDPKDKWYFRNLYRTCVHRYVTREVETCSSCGNSKVKYYACKLFEKEITFVECTHCEERQEV